MTEVRVGTWNALSAFGDETLSRERMVGALQIVKRMDADVLAIQEMARYDLHPEHLERERLEEVTELMNRAGYQGVATGYSPYKDERNVHFLSLWTRIGHNNQPVGGVQLFGRRNGLRLFIPGIDVSMYGIHQDDRYPVERVRAARALLSTVVGEAIVMGDFNDMYADDPKGNLPRVLGKVVNRVELKDYYNHDKRLQRLAGKVIRVCRMTGGESLQAFTAEGFHDADPARQPTVGKGRLAFQIDHIIGTPGITFKNFTVHDRRARRNGQPISNHSPISALAQR